MPTPPDEPGDSRTLAEKVDDIRRQLVHSPPPEAGADVPAWMSGGIEGLPEFFNAVAELWDERFGDDPGSPFLAAMAEPIEPTHEPVRILDIGIGTGLELPAIFERARNARITGIDLAGGMLAELRRNFADRMQRITLIEGSCLTVPFGEAAFDYVVSRLTMHHFGMETKLGVYRRVRSALRPGGRYVEGDQSTSPQFERQVLRWYDDYIARLPEGDRGRWNYDVTLSADTQRRLLGEAGFASVELVAEERNAEGHGWAVFAASP